MGLHIDAAKLIATAAADAVHVSISEVGEKGALAASIAVARVIAASITEAGLLAAATGVVVPEASRASTMQDDAANAAYTIFRNEARADMKEKPFSNRVAQMEDAKNAVDSADAADGCE